MTSRFLRGAAHAAIVLALALLGYACDRGRAPLNSAVQGRRLYQMYGCAACHGAEGRGDGPASTSTPARDFRNPSSFRRGRSIDDVASTIGSGMGAMPSFSYVPERERRQLAAYVVSLAGTKGKNS